MCRNPKNLTKVEKKETHFLSEKMMKMKEREKQKNQHKNGKIKKTQKTKK